MNQQTSSFEKTSRTKPRIPTAVPKSQRRDKGKTWQRGSDKRDRTYD